MDNKVGDNVPSAKELAQMRDQFLALVAKFRKFGVTVDPEARKRQLHWRLGADPHVTRVHDLAVKHGVNLKNAPLAGMVADRALMVAMEPFVAEFRAATTLVEDTAGQAESESWQAFLAYYGVLSSMAERDPVLASELADVIAFLATGPQKKPAPPAVK